MCILCKNKKTNLPIVDTGLLAQTEVDRAGLSNIYNVSNTLAFCNETFKNPLYYLDGTVKATSAYTTTACSGITTASTYSTTGCTAVYNFSEIDDFTLTFNITGNTQYTGYTGDFCYHTFDIGKLITGRDYVTKQESVLSDCFIFSGITGNTITETISVGELPIKDAQYLIKDYNFFYTKNCQDKLRINTFDLTTQPTESLFSDGWYFITVTNPAKPSIGVGVNPGLTDSTTLKTETPELVAGQTSVFKINGVPLNNKMLVYVNGVQLIEGLDWVSLPESVGLINITSGTLKPSRDTVSVTYLNLNRDTADIFNLNEQYLQMDAMIVTGITTDVTYSGASRPSVNYNTVKSRQEMLLTSPIKGFSDILFVVNGVTLTINKDYYLSSSDNRRLIIDPSGSIDIGDAISIFYLTDDSSDLLDLGYFRGLQPEITWSVPSSYEKYLSKNGRFLLQVTTESDPNFDTPIQSNFTDFEQLNNIYTYVLDELPTNVGEKFLVRVYFFKDYPILFNNIITTRNVSDTATFKVNINFSKNSY
jgi:hypothetical protein